MAPSWHAEVTIVAHCAQPSIECQRVATKPDLEPAYYHEAETITCVLSTLSRIQTKQCVDSTNVFSDSQQLTDLAAKFRNRSRITPFFVSFTIRSHLESKYIKHKYTTIYRSRQMDARFHFSSSLFPKCANHNYHFWIYLY